MKFVFFSAAVFLVAGTQLQAQSGQIRAGINLANVSVNDNGRVEDANSLTSFHAGIIGDFPLAGNFLSLQPGILFTGKGSKIQN